VGSNNINIQPPVLANLAGTPAVHTSEVFDIRDFTAIIVDVVLQRVGGVDSTVQIRVQQSDDGVLWHDPPFVSTLSTSVAVPRPRTQVSATPTRKLARVTFSNTTANPTNLDYTVTRKSNA
jgi:hypothetical protein